MNTQETNLRRTSRELRESRDRLSAEMAKDPQAKAMAEALRITPAEQAAIDAAQAAVEEAEAAVNATGTTLNRAERGIAPTYDRKQPFSFFQKRPETHRAAASAAVPGLRIDVEEARVQLQSAIRRRNDTARQVELARMERRRAAKAKHTSPRPSVRSRADRWNSGREAA